MPEETIIQENAAQADTPSGNPESEFSGAFSDALGEGTTSDLTDDAATKEAPEVTEVDDGEVAGEAEGETPPAVPDEPPPKAEDWEQKYKTLQGMYNKLEKKSKEAIPPEEKKEEAAPPKEVTPATGQSLDFSPLFKDLASSLPKDMLPELAEYERDMDVVSKFEGAKREAMANRLLTYVHEMFNVFSGQLQPYLKATEKVAVSSKSAAIARTHSDYETLRESGEIKEWIETQPTFLREPMLKAYEAGEAEDVVELITRYKKEAGKTELAPSIPVEKPVDPKVAERVRNLQIVKNKQKGINATKDTVGDPDDFSSAFKEALANIK